MAGVCILKEFAKDTGYGSIEPPSGDVPFPITKLINGGEHDLVQWVQVTYELDAQGRATDVDSFPPPLPPRRPPPPPPPAAGLPPHLGLVRYRHPGLLETLGEEKSCRQSLDSPSHSHTGSARGRRGRCRGYPRRVWGAGGGARWGLCVCVRACFYMYHFCVLRAAGTLWRLSASSGSCAV